MKEGELQELVKNTPEPVFAESEPPALAPVQVVAVAPDSVKKTPLLVRREIQDVAVEPSTEQQTCERKAMLE